MYILIFSLVALLVSLAALIMSIRGLRRARRNLQELGGLPTQAQLVIDQEISNRQFDLMGIVMHAHGNDGEVTDDMVARARVLHDELQVLQEQRDCCSERN